MRILFDSNSPWAATGYGTQTKLFPARMKSMLGHEMAIMAFYGLEGAIINWNGIPIYPRWAHPYGLDIVTSHAQHFKADILITLLDAWVFDSNAFKQANIKWCPWFMVDCEPLQLAVYRQIKESFMPIVCSRHAEMECNKADLKTVYVPLGIDTKVFKPVDKTAAREATRLPKDKFIVGMVAANKDPFDRKGFHSQIEAFKSLHMQYPDTFLYMHTAQSQQAGQGFAALNLREFASYHGLREGEDYAFCDQYGYVLGYAEEHMTNIYSSFDVLLNASKGEGFGIPIVEAQACGTPVIVGDWTAMTELLFAGWKVEKSEAERLWNGQGAYMFTPRVDAIADRLIQAYKAAGETYPQAVTSAAEYDADTITETYWRAALDTIQERISGADTELKLVKF
jgi:glycosyltransferase involved in cell wall biosynthesis